MQFGLSLELQEIDEDEQMQACMDTYSMELENAVADYQATTFLLPLHEAALFTPVMCPQPLPLRFGRHAQCLAN